MAQNWEMDKETGIFTRNYETNVSPKGEKAEWIAEAEPLEFDITEIFENFTEMSEVQQGFIFNGHKQKFDDKLAGMPKDATQADKREVHAELKKQIWEEKTWNKRTKGERTPGVNSQQVVATYELLIEAGYDAEIAEEKTIKIFGEKAKNFIKKA
jgi:hypothetical protein